MKKGTKKIIAVILAIVIIGVGAWALWPKGFEKGVASFDDLLNSSSTRAVPNTPCIASDDSPYFALIATPVAVYYEGSSQRASPLLAVNSQEPSRAVIRFLNMYGNPPVATIGTVPTTLSSSEREWEDPTTVALNNAGKTFTGSLKDISINVAKHFWARSDGVVIVEPNQESYNRAVVVVPFAAYLNIPVIVIDKMDSSVGDALKALGVKYSIVCQGANNVEGYGKTKRFASVEEAQDWMMRIVRERLGSDVDYITLTNPIDIYKPKVIESLVVLDKSGEIEHSPSTSYPGRPEVGITESVSFDISYPYANINVDLTLDISEETRGDLSGARMYAYLGVDTTKDGKFEEDDKIQYFGGSPAQMNRNYTTDPTVSQAHLNPPKTTEAIFDTQIPIFNDIGTHWLGLVAKIPSDEDKWTTPPGQYWKAPYHLTVTVEKLESYIYPKMKSSSSLAPYLTAYRKGVVLAKPSYMIYDDEYVKIPDSSNPAANLELIEPTNNRVGEVKKDLNNLLGRMAIPEMSARTDSEIIALAEYYHALNENGNYTYLGIIADPQMIPHYYYPSKGLGADSQEGYLVPGDNIYSDIDADLNMPPYGLSGGYPRLELADGRITGFGSQDISALLCRTFFYGDIIDKIEVRENIGRLGSSWNDNGFGMIGSEPPVGAAATAREKVGWQWQEAGFTVDTESRNRQLAGRQDATSLYESSNFIFICSHGFWYWYVPTASKSMIPYYEAGGGGAMDVAHVRLMEFAPSVMWASSCVTSRIDGIEPYNCLSNAFLHGGMNCYVGGTRSMWGVLIPNPDARSGEKMGDLMMLYWYAHMCGYLYDKSQGSIIPIEEKLCDLSTGAALMLAKNTFIEIEGTDGAAENDDTYEEVLLHGDPAFNPYEPNHEGSALMSAFYTGNNQ